MLEGVDGVVGGLIRGCEQWKTSQLIFLWDASRKKVEASYFLTGAGAVVSVVGRWSSVGVDAAMRLAMGILVWTADPRHVA